MKLLTKEQEESYENAKIYYMLYHCHYTGEYRGAGDSICNLVK